VAQITIILGNIRIRSKRNLTCSASSWLKTKLVQTREWVNCEASKALNGIKLISRYFSTKGLIQIITSNYCSILYYNCEVWLLQSLSETIKHSLLAVSSKTLKVALRYPKRLISY
jgi:hypothetical protein